MIVAINRVSAPLVHRNPQIDFVNCRNGSFSIQQPKNKAKKTTLRGRHRSHPAIASAAAFDQKGIIGEKSQLRTTRLHGLSAGKKLPNPFARDASRSISLSLARRSGIGIVMLLIWPRCEQSFFFLSFFFSRRKRDDEKVIKKINHKSKIFQSRVCVCVWGGALSVFLHDEK